MDGEKKSAHFRQISDKLKIKAYVADVDSEIGVFGAEKYFSMKLDHVDSMVDINKQQHEKENKEDTKTLSSRSRTSRHGTPSLRSESSYNSQNFLMRIGNNNDNKKRKTKETSLTCGGFRCNGPCSGVKTVNTDRKISGKGRISDRDFVAYDARKRKDELKFRFKANKTDYHEQEMIPLPNKKSDIAMNFEKKLSLLTWDARPNQLSSKNNNGNNLSSKTQEEETSSETSSDLFELENITNSIYDPSEASIGWSAVTGSMVNQSVTSDFKRVGKSSSVAKTKPAMSEKVRSGGFLSCKSHKAVSVVNNTRNVKEAAKLDHEISHQNKKFKTETRIQDLTFL